MDFPSTPQQHQPKQACDNCRFRKTKCDRELPCRSCVATSIPCQYLRPIRRPGPRAGRRLLHIKRGFTNFEKDHIEVNTPAQIQRKMAEDQKQAAAVQIPSPIYIPSPIASGMTMPVSTVEPDQSKGQLTFPLAANVQVFLKHIFPIMPVLNEIEILADALQFDELPPPRQTLIMSLCAATRIQLKLDYTGECGEVNRTVDAAPEPSLTGEGLLLAAKRLRRQFDIVDNLGPDAILTSFFLFAAHGNLEQHYHAAYYLNESLSLAISLGLDNEATYSTFAPSDRQVHRRIFWLLFVTERTYALQHRRPVMLRSTILKPQIVGSDHPVIMHDFVNHIRLFEMLPHSLYDWLPDNDPSQQQGQGIMLSQRVGERLCTVRATDSVLESQSLDTLVTQQWLRVSMWRLTCDVNFGQGSGRGLSKSLELPFAAAKPIMSRLHVASQESKECHGIALEQKLFDIGMSLADVSMAAPLLTSSSEFGSVDMLSAIVKCLDDMRGSRSHFLLRLLKHSEAVLGCTSPTSQINMQWAICDGSSGALQDYASDNAKMQSEEGPGNALAY